MKKQVLIGFALIVCAFTSKAQSDEIKRGLYDCKLSYVFSTKETENPGANSWGINEPFGIGISTSYRFNKSFFAELGLTYKANSKQKETYTNINQEEIVHEYQYSSIEFPIQLHYNLFNHKAIHLYACAGLKGSLALYHDDWNPFYKDVIINSNTHEYRIAYSLGLLESFDLTNKIGVFASQNFGHFFANKAKGNTFTYTASDIYYDDHVDFNIGISYKI